MSKSQTPIFEWQIKDKIKETPDSYTYVFSPLSASDRFTFNVGEFVTIKAFLKRPTTSGGIVGDRSRKGIFDRFLTNKE